MDRMGEPRRGGRLPDPGMGAICGRCGEPREAHGGPSHLGACPGESGIDAKRFSIEPGDRPNPEWEEPARLPLPPRVATAVDDLAAWLRAQLDDDEQRTRKLLAYAQQTILTLQDPRHLGKFIPGWHDWPDVERMCTDRLAEIEAKRRILEAEQDRVLEEGPLPERMRDLVDTEVIRLLALPYADRDGYREEWRP